MRTRLLARLAAFAAHRSTVVTVIALAALIGSIAILPGLQIRGGHTALAGPDNIHERRYAEFLQQFGSPDLLFLLVEGGSADERREVVDQVTENLLAQPPDLDASAEHPRLVRDVLAHLDMGRFLDWALLYLPPETLQTVVDTVRGQPEAIRMLAATSSLADFLSLYSSQLEKGLLEAPSPLTLTTTDPQERSNAEMPLRLLTALLTQMQQALETTKTPAPLLEALTKSLGWDSAKTRMGIDAQGYLTSYDGDTHLMIIRPTSVSDDPDFILPLVDFVRQTGTHATKQHGQRGGSALSATLTGYPAIVAEETRALGRDLPLTSALSITGVFLLFIFVLRSLRQGLLALFILAFTLTLTLAFTRIAIGELNMMTSSAMPMLIGLCIDFSIHILARFNEARQSGSTRAEAAAQTISAGGPALMTGALTTAAAFSVLATNEYQAFAQMSLVGAVGLLIGLFANLVLMPALLADRRLHFLRPFPRARKQSDQARLRLPQYLLRFRLPIVIGSAALTAGMFFIGDRIPWSYDYLDLLPRNAPSVTSMRRLADETGFSMDVAAIRVPSLKAAHEITERLQALPTVGRVESVATFLPENQVKKRDLLQGLRPIVASLPNQSADATSNVDPNALLRETTRLADNLEDAHFLAKRAALPLAVQLGAAAQKARAFEGKLATHEGSNVAQRMASVQHDWIALSRRAIDTLRRSLNSKTLNAETLADILPEGLRHRLISDTEYAVYAYPVSALNSEEAMTAFVEDIRRVDAKATGFPITHWEATRSTQHAVQSALLWCALVLVVIVFIDFRNILYTALALAPLFFGLTWMWGGMALFGIPYNLANIFAFPLIVGVGVDYGVHLLHRVRQEGPDQLPNVLRHTGAAILLCGATTMVGFGSLVLCSHQGASSVGQTLLLGVGACLAASLVTLPAIVALRSSTSPE